MAYEREIPRDLFNEANLLKCYGQLCILCERLPGLEVKTFFTKKQAPFDIDQEPDSGDIFIRNLLVTLNGYQLQLRRPLNSREAWPLCVTAVDLNDRIDPFPVFDSVGGPSGKLLELAASTRSKRKRR